MGRLRPYRAVIHDQSLVRWVEDNMGCLRCGASIRLDHPEVTIRTHHVIAGAATICGPVECDLGHVVRGCRSFRLPVMEADG